MERRASRRAPKARPVKRVAVAALDDVQALALLQRMYRPENGRLDRAGRHVHHVPATVTRAEREALAARGLAPNTFRRFTHDAAVKTIRRLAADLEERAAADVFVAGLAPRAARWRAALTGWALGTTMPAHRAKVRAGSQVCDVCFVGASEAVDLTEAWVHGQAGSAPLPGDVCGSILGLEALAAGPAPQPSPREVWVLHRALEVLEGLPRSARSGAAEAALLRERLVPGWPRWAYRSLLEDLSILGLLASAEHPGLLTRFTTARERDQRPSVRVEVSAPLGFWTAADGVDRRLARRLFGHLPRPRRAPPPPPPPVRPAARAPSARVLTPPHLRGEPRPGDVYAVGCREDFWVLAYCWKLANVAGRRRGLVEYLDARFTRPPTEEDVATTGLRLRGRGPRERWQLWASHLDAAPRVRRVARGVAPPADRRPEPDRIPLGHAQELRSLAGWCFDELT